ncbi:MAG TPA: lipid-A-disaccharide synthase [Mariprofundaceae bacterium]|nr:lipid-A-disaccharide synthase [Mariprofundaceae bacterium]
MRVFVSAGEVSGDMHAASVIRALRMTVNIDETYGIAGPCMREAGCDTLVEMNELNVMGIGDVLRALPRIYRIRRRVLAELEAKRPDVAILVDFPGFHMNLGIRLRRMGIPVLHYIAPKLWAWGSWRIRRLKKSQDRLASILPFEPAWFAERGITARYVGNPSVAAIHHQEGERSTFRSALALSDDVPLLSILPGSRPGELDRHLPLLLEAWKQIRQRMPDARCVVPVAPGVSMEQLQPLADAGAVLLDRMAEDYALHTDAAIAVSGTATLELALWDIPTVLIYRTSPFTLFLARRLVRLNCIGLANIIMDDTPVMPELIQSDATVANITDHAVALLSGGMKAANQHRAFRELRQRLGEINPAREVAAMAVEMCTGDRVSN